MPTAIAMLHPGEMGAAVANCLVRNGHRVIWASEGRSESTRQRAQAAGLIDGGSLQQTLSAADLALAVCPPHAAVSLAHEVAKSTFAGIYVDANAVAPGTAREVAGIVSAGGKVSFVDGCIIGLPPTGGGSTRMYLAGSAAAEVSALFDGSALQAPVLASDIGSASALKVCYAAWSKGSVALLTNIRALAAAEGVDTALAHEWELSAPDALQRSGLVSGQARKAWRWVGEMEEIADSFGAAGLPDGFHHAAAEIYRRLATFKDAGSPVAIDEIIAAVLRQAQEPRT